MRYAIVAALLATVVLSTIVGSSFFDRIVPIVRVNVHWQPGTTVEAREYTARTFSLYLIRPDEDDVWVCMLADASPENVGAIFESPAIADVVGLSRTTRQPNAIDRTSPLAWIGYRFPNLKTDLGFDANRVVRRAAMFPLFVICLLMTLFARPSGRRWLVERIPMSSPLAMGLFRVAFAIAWTFAVAAIPETRPGLRTESVALLVLFGIGVFPRVALVALAFLWLPGATHDTAMPAKTLLLLAVVPWADGLSVTEAVRRWRGRGTPHVERRVYGLATWIPVAMMGLAYSAAAFAKLDESGLRWITDGVVRYFFVVDAPNAPNDLGRVVAASDWLSVAMAGGAVLTEACVIVAALYSRPLVVLAAGAGALMLHSGFWFFQGVWWPAWWAMLPAFLPWSSAARAMQTRTVVPTAPGWGEIPVVTALVLGVVALQQPLVSLARFEYRPLFSDFSMYSDSQWSSKQEFAAYMEREKAPTAVALRLTRADGTGAGEIEARLREVDPGRAVMAAARLLAEGSVPDETEREQVRAIGERYEERFGTPMPPLRVASASWHFDWSVADFTPNSTWHPAGVLEVTKP